MVRLTFAGGPRRQRERAANVGGELGGLRSPRSASFRKPTSALRIGLAGALIESFENLIVSQHHRRHPPCRTSSLTAER